MRARFEREARAISELEHPHICTLHDLGEENGQAYLVMEHLSGETFAERLKKGPLPLSQALEVAIQIADALSTAYRQGIIHRDLKPGNVMLTKARVRLLDFGLGRDPVRESRSRSTAVSTQPGTPLGVSSIFLARDRSGNGRMMVADVRTSPSSASGPPALSSACAAQAK